jgi:hypothetical protein
MRLLLTIPHYSQHLNVSEYWKQRSCAVACTKMVLDARRKKSPILQDLILECEDSYGYDENRGWAHVAISGILEKYGIFSERKEYKNSEELFETGVQDIVFALRKGNPVMISTIKNWEDEKKFHMVLFVGFEAEDGEFSGFYYHDPDVEESGLGENLFVSFDRFKKYWRRLAIFPYIDTNIRMSTNDTNGNEC